MVCILDSTVNFKEMHKLKRYAVCKGEMAFSFMGSNERQGKLQWSGKLPRGWGAGTFKLGGAFSPLRCKLYKPHLVF